MSDGYVPYMSSVSQTQCGVVSELVKTDKMHEMQQKLLRKVCCEQIRTVFSSGFTEFFPTSFSLLLLSSHFGIPQSLSPGRAAWVSENLSTRAFTATLNSTFLSISFLPLQVPVRRQTNSVCILVRFPGPLTDGERNISLSVFKILL